MQNKIQRGNDRYSKIIIFFIAMIILLFWQDVTISLAIRSDTLRLPVLFNEGNDDLIGGHKKNRRVISDLSCFKYTTDREEQNLAKLAQRQEMQNRIFQIQSIFRTISWRDDTSYLVHFRNQKGEQVMVGTRPVQTIRDINWFSHCYWGKDITDILRGSNVVVAGFGPKWPELLLPHLDSEGLIVDPLAAKVANIWGIDFLLERILEAAIAISEPLSKKEAIVNFPGVDNIFDYHRVNPHRQQTDMVVPDMYFIEREMLEKARGKVKFCHAAIDKIPRDLIQDNSIQLITAVGLFDSETFADTLFGVSDYDPRVLGGVGEILKRFKAMLDKDGLLVIGRSNFSPGNDNSLHKVLVAQAAKQGLSSIFFVKEDEIDSEDLLLYFPGSLFGFINDGRGGCIFIPYPFPVAVWHSRGCVGGWIEYPKWQNEDKYIDVKELKS